MDSNCRFEIWSSRGLRDDYMKVTAAVVPVLPARSKSRRRAAAADDRVAPQQSPRHKRGRQPGSPRPRTGSSNPSLSSEESVANSIWAKAASPVRSPPRLLAAARAGSRAPRSIHCSLRRPSAPTAARSSMRSAGGASFSQLIADGIVAETLPAGTPPGQQRPAEGMAAR